MQSFISRGNEKTIYNTIGEKYKSRKEYNTIEKRTIITNSDSHVLHINYICLEAFERIKHLTG